MALDGIFLHHLQAELSQQLIGGRVDKIHQPNKDELVFVLRTTTAAHRLLFSARATSARVTVIASGLENPKQPPMLCMLLRKKLSGARLIDIQQPELERVLFFIFDAVNELGDRVKLTLAAEIMGKFSNIILLDEERRVIDALKRVDPDTSSLRLVLPGIPYSLPPAQEKCCLLEDSHFNILDKIDALPKDMELSKALLSVLQGVSPIVCRELQHQVGRGKDLFIRSMNDEERFRLGFFIQNLRETAQTVSGTPYMAIDLQGKPLDFSFMDIHQYGTHAVVRTESTFSTLLESFYRERDSIDRMRVKQQDVFRLLTNYNDRISRKIMIQKGELAESEDRDKLRIAGDLLSANLHLVPKGAAAITLPNFYDETMSDLSIKLDPALSPSQNAQKYYKRYRKAKKAQEVLQEQIRLSEKELIYLDSVLEALARAETEADLAEIRVELSETGYLKASKAKKERTAAVGKPLEFDVEGFKIYVGRNNKQNDKLTLRSAKKNDLWFHTKNIPGSHVILALEGMQPPVSVLQHAAFLAAKHSRASSSANVPVDYTRVKNVSKPQGAKPGMVIYVDYKTLYANPQTDVQL